MLSQKVPYDPLRDFTPICNVGSTPLVLVVNPKLPVKNAKDFVAYVNSSREPVPYGSAGNGNITHMAAELFIQNTGLTNLRHIPYKGSSQVLTDLLAGNEPEKERSKWEEKFLWAQENGFIPAGRINSAAGTDLAATLINCFVQPVGDG